MLRRGALGLGERIVHRFGQVEAVHLKAVHFKLRHAGKCAHLLGVALDARLGGFARGAVFVSRGASGQHQRGRHALQVPLEWAANRLIEVVDVEDQPPVGRGVCAQVAHMRVAAKLAHDAGRRKLRQVRGHHRRCAAKVSERRLGHELILELDQRRHAAAHRSLYQFQSRGRPRLGMQCFVLMAAHLLAPRLAKCAPFFRSCPVHTGGSPIHSALRAFVQCGFSFREKPLSLCGSRVGQL